MIGLGCAGLKSAQLRSITIGYSNEYPFDILLSE